jgi:hypothetical protein
MARAEGPTRPPGNGPSAASALRECETVHGRGHYGSSSGGRRLMSWRAPDSASRLGRPQATPVPSPRSLGPPRASLSRPIGAMVVCATNNGRCARVATRGSTSHCAGRLVVGSNPTAGAISDWDAESSAKRHR